MGIGGGWIVSFPTGCSRGIMRPRSWVVTMRRGVGADRAGLFFAVDRSAFDCIRQLGFRQDVSTPALVYLRNPQ